MAYSQNTLTLSGFTVEADREPVGDNKTVTSTFNLCDYLLADCSELVIVRGNIEYGGHVQVDDHQVTVTFPIWAGDVSLSLTISDGLDAVNVPVILAQPIIEKETINQVQGGTMGWYALWLLCLSALSRGLSIKFYPKSGYAIH